MLKALPDFLSITQVQSLKQVGNLFCPLLFLTLFSWVVARLYAVGGYSETGRQLATDSCLSLFPQAMTTVGQRIPSPVLEYGKDPTVVLLRDEQQPALSFYVLDQLRRRNQFCDVVIKLEGAQLPDVRSVIVFSTDIYYVCCISTSVIGADLHPIGNF